MSSFDPPDHDAESEAPRAAAVTLPPSGRCQICGAPHEAAESILCRVCGEPVLLWGWA